MDPLAFPNDVDRFFDTTVVSIEDSLPLTRRQARRLAKRQAREARRTKVDTRNPRPSYNLKPLPPITVRQHQAYEAFHQGNNLVLTGFAGTGKSMTALYLACESMEDKSSDIDSIIIYRSAVASRDMGFLPGKAEAKIEVYEAPYRAIIAKLYGSAAAYDQLKKIGKISFQSTSFSRGLTIDNTVVILEEAQNYTWQEIYTLVTRLGPTSKLIITGDVRQNDLVNTNEFSGFSRMVSILNQVGGTVVIDNQIDDIVRSDFVKSVIIAATAQEGYYRQPTKG